MPNHKYTAEERLEMVRRHYGGATYQSIRDYFAAENPNRPVPSIGTIQDAVRMLETHYCLVYEHKPKGKRSAVLSEEVRFEICAAAAQNWRLSALEISKRVGVSESSVGKTLRINGFRSPESSLVRKRFRRKYRDRLKNRLPQNAATMKTKPQDIKHELEPNQVVESEDPEHRMPVFCEVLLEHIKPDPDDEIRFEEVNI